MTAWGSLTQTCGWSSVSSLSREVRMAGEKRCSVRVLVFGASLRQGSLNDRLATLAARVIEQFGGAADLASMLEFDCPPYDGDVERDEGVPPGAERLRDRLTTADAFIIASPEYNASLPGILKNTIDWTSRVRPQPFNGKQGMLLSASPSMVGGNRGLWALRVPLEHLGARVYPDMFSLAQAHEAFDASGDITNETLRSRFDGTIECFLDLVEAAKHYPALKKRWVEFLGEAPDDATDRDETSPVTA
jgi:chromate reductase